MDTERGRVRRRVFEATRHDRRGNVDGRRRPFVLVPCNKHEYVVFILFIFLLWSSRSSRTHSQSRPTTASRSRPARTSPRTTTSRSSSSCTTTTVPSARVCASLPPWSTATTTTCAACSATRPSRPRSAAPACLRTRCRSSATTTTATTTTFSSARAHRDGPSACQRSACTGPRAWPAASSCTRTRTPRHTPPWSLSSPRTTSTSTTVRATKSPRPFGRPMCVYCAQPH